MKLVTSADGESDSFIILVLLNSVEFEQELNLRFTGVFHSSPEFRVPQFMYLGMFAGATKPKPFQRKRPNISRLASGKLVNFFCLILYTLSIYLQVTSNILVSAAESKRYALNG